MLSEYYAKMERTQTGCVPTHKPLSSLPPSKQTRMMSSSSSPSSSSWTSNGLIWTTIIALSIAGVATMVIVPLVLCAQVRQRCTGKRVPGATGARQGSSTSYSAVEAGTILTPSNLPTTPIYIPPNGLKEKSGKLTTQYWFYNKCRLIEGYPTPIILTKLSLYGEGQMYPLFCHYFARFSQ